LTRKTGKETKVVSLDYRSCPQYQNLATALEKINSVEVRTSRRLEELGRRNPTDSRKYVMSQMAEELHLLNKAYATLLDYARNVHPTICPTCQGIKQQHEKEQAKEKRLVAERSASHY